MMKQLKTLDYKVSKERQVLDEVTRQWLSK